MAVADGLIHAWEMDEASGDCIDRIGTDDLNIVQGTDSAGVGGKVNGARDFSGTMEARQVASDIDLASVDAYSVALWIKTTGIFAGNKRVWTSFAGTGVRQQGVIGATNRFFVVQTYAVAANTNVVAPVEFAMTPGAWYHIVYSWERNSVNRLYQQGGLIDTNTTPDESTQTLGTPTWSVGANLAGGERTNAVIDQLWVWDRAITQVDVTELFASGFGVNFDGLVAFDSKANDLIRLGEAGQQILQPLVIKSMRFVADPSSLTTDVFRLTDPVTGVVLWEGYAGSSVGTEAELTAGGLNGAMTYPNGIRLDELTGNRGVVAIRYG